LVQFTTIINLVPFFNAEDTERSSSTDF